MKRTAIITAGMKDLGMGSLAGAIDAGTTGMWMGMSFQGWKPVIKLRSFLVCKSNLICKNLHQYLLTELITFNAHLQTCIALFNSLQHRELSVPIHMLH